MSQIDSGRLDVRLGVFVIGFRVLTLTRDFLNVMMLIVN
ncbi:hypothetical protein STRCR_0548 [Streptococcus criceti HS-6]|uniref:Uncharacterized protein n=1 Tax=Streptococcus criceti HS-6 TaxID=873449 RepID=G5JQG4_STRCG|nr:hypothetical protein STRCR_0548 [Streptococcus criceti HS-6]